MKLTAIMAVGAASSFSALAVQAGSPRPTPKVGEEYEITKSYESSQRTSDGSSGSSRGRDTFVERVIGVREGGLELEYDLSKDATAADRTRNWQFPTRIFKSSSGPVQLLNGRELETRVESWLKAAGLTRAACGHWIFTWNAFRIECDPQSVIKTIDEISLVSADIREGISYQAMEARGPGMLMRKADGLSGAKFAVNLEVDPEAVRRARAESDVAVGEIMRKPVALDAALRERAKENISGTILITFDTDPTGNVLRRTKVTKLETKRPDGSLESEASTETIERRPVTAAPARR